MKKQINQSEISIRWQYGRNRSNGLKENETRCIVTIQDPECEPVELVGNTFCCKKDPFCKETARRTSLTRALWAEEAVVLIGRPERAEVWNMYWERKPEIKHEK
jgi:hypothetical protein